MAVNFRFFNAVNQTVNQNKTQTNAVSKQKSVATNDTVSFSSNRQQLPGLASVAELYKRRDSVLIPVLQKAKGIADYVFGAMQKSDFQLGGNLNGIVKNMPIHSHTGRIPADTSLAMEMMDGFPHAIYTPVGGVVIRNSFVYPNRTAKNRVLRAITEKLGLVPLIQQGKFPKDAHIWADRLSVFAITKDVRGKRMPITSGENLRAGIFNRNAFNSYYIDEKNWLRKVVTGIFPERKFY
jgi:hypothetical protein